MSQSFDTSRSLTALEQDNTIIAVIEMSKAKWLVAALIPGLKRQPLKKIDAVAPALLKLMQRGRDEAGRAGHTVQRIAVAYEAAGDGFWLARWLRAHLPAEPAPGGGQAGDHPNGGGNAAAGQHPRRALPLP
ncbi:hypothetical protein NKH75_29425 [Mesorhizobium sp. M0984]|uniref:hypothetical protein n=1 Tax=Mesorhizobium sp. M0984 TaxID=2957041 RepID=UPI00333B9BCD